MNEQSIAQDSASTSLAFKNNKPAQRTLFYQPDLSYQLWRQFTLIRQANSGDVLAQHELGLRYLLGEGTPPDTLKGAYWIQKAAEKQLTAAMYNYAILLMNGWGVSWNPFKAYDYFLKAAKDSMPQAEYIIGIIYTDNLIIKKDWNEAYAWVKKAADSGLDYAKKTLAEIKEKIPASLLDTTSAEKQNNKSFDDKNNNSFAAALGLAFIDFDAVNDTIKEITNEMLRKDLILIGNKDLTDTLKISDDKIPQIDSSDIPIILKAAEAGSPEALVFIGSLYEKGIFYKKNLITASSYYLRAIRLDSPKAPWLLWKISSSENYLDQLKNLVSKEDPEAMFVWYGLYSNGFNNQIVKKDALNLLKKAAGKKYLPAINELGLAFNNGKIIDQNKDKAFELWKDAEALGSFEAKDRIATAKVFGFIKSQDLKNQINILEKSNSEGSILAQVALAHSYEKGIVVNQDKAEAVKLYRLAAQRGNRYAYSELKRMYDEIRPDESEFKIN